MSETKVHREPSREEIAEIVETGERLVARSLYTMLCEYLPQLKESLVIPESSGYVKISLEGYKESLIIALKPVTANYKADIEVPNEAAAKDLFAQYNLIKAVAITFWKHWAAINPTIVELLKFHYPGVSFDTLAIDQTTLYFDPAFRTRIGLVPAYVDKHGNLLVKKR